jgi:hypothetical protein
MQVRRGRRAERLSECEYITFRHPFIVAPMILQRSWGRYVISIIVLKAQPGWSFTCLTALCSPS